MSAADRVRHASLGIGTLLRREALGRAMADCLVRFDVAPIRRFVCGVDASGERYSYSFTELRPGYECWIAGYTLRFFDGGKLRDRAEIRTQADYYSAVALRTIRSQLINDDWHKPWPGMEFAKAHVGMMIDRALAETKDRR